MDASLTDQARSPRAQRTREIAREVLIEAFGASATPFVPVPFVDDMLLSRLLRRIAKKVLERHGITAKELPKTIADAYMEAGSPSTGESIMKAGVRFVVRKVAVVMDVKKSHDVFGEAIALALALDVAAENRIVDEVHGKYLGAAIYRALQRVGAGPIEALVRVGREAWAKSKDAKGENADKAAPKAEGAAAPAEGAEAAPDASRMAVIAEALGGEIEKVRVNVDHALRWEWAMGARR